VAIQNMSQNAHSLLSGAITAPNAELRCLIALLGGTGLRIGEALAIGCGNVWNPIQGSITVSGTLVNGTFQPSPKTQAGNRVVDLDPALNHFLRTTLADTDGPVFHASESNFRRQLVALGIPGFHSLRRFRITHLQGHNVPTTLVKFWAGHAAGDVTERYTKIGSQIQERKDWSAKAGLGFQL
jgi:integrase